MPWYTQEFLRDFWLKVIMVLCILDRSCARICPLDLAPVCHCSADASQTSDLNNLLMPTQKHAHGGSCWFVHTARSSSHLAEASCRLGCNLVRCSRSCSGMNRSHSLVNVLHQNIQALGTSIGTVDALQQGGHIAGLDRLKNFNNGVQMRIL
jgi:hypothetical protein